MQVVVRQNQTSTTAASSLPGAAAAQQRCAATAKSKNREETAATIATAQAQPGTDAPGWDEAAYWWRSLWERGLSCRTLFHAIFFDHHGDPDPEILFAASSSGGSLASFSLSSSTQTALQLLNDDLDALFNRYTSLATELLNLKKSGTIFQNLSMAICIGAGSLLCCILKNGAHSMKFTDVTNFVGALRHMYMHPYPPLLHLGGMFGAVNAFGAGAGDLIGMCCQPMNTQIKHEKESSLVRGPVLTSPVGETLSTSMVQEIFLFAKDADNNHIQNYAAWAISLLRSRLLLKNQSLYDDDCSQRSSIDSSPSTSFPGESLVWNLGLWLRDLSFEKV